MWRISFRLLIVGLMLLCGSCSQAKDRITVQLDPDHGTAHITIRAVDSRISWKAIALAVARAKGLDDSALCDSEVFANTYVRLDSAWTFAVMTMTNNELGPGLKLSTLAPPGGKGEPSLCIDIDEPTLLASSRMVKQRLRRAIVPPGLNETMTSRRVFGLQCDAGWQDTPTSLPLVVFIHGLHASPARFGSFIGDVREAGFPVATAAYANDQPIEDTARWLSEKIKEATQGQPGRPVCLVTRSMGGLVAREIVENPALDPGNVRRLIMVAPPNQGSRLAQFGFTMELFEHGVRDKDRALLTRFYESIEDGLGEAYADLTPGSAFLTKLNARPRNPKIHYTIFLGSGAFLDAATLGTMAARLHEMGDQSRLVRFMGPRLDALLADLDEVVAGQGDGAVAIKRGRLDGVEDTVVLPFNHLTMVAEDQTDAQRQLREQILERIEAPLD